KWKELTKYFLEIEKKYPQRVKIITYENLTKNTIEEVKNIFDFIGTPIHKQTFEFINQSKTFFNNDTYSTFKGNKNVDDWKSELSQSIIDKIHSELEGTEFKQFI
ncbi:MAG: sulfotransferase domain-containing protein, partial [bacterium]